MAAQPDLLPNAPPDCHLLDDVLPKVFAFVPGDLQCLAPLRVVNQGAKESVKARWREALCWKADLRITSSLRVASRYAKECVEARWWTAQVQCMKAFVDRHANVFADDPEIDEENEDVVAQQQAFARNVQLWIDPLLVNQPWRYNPRGTAPTTLHEAYSNLRQDLANLSHPDLHLEGILPVPLSNFELTLVKAL